VKSSGMGLLAVFNPLAIIGSLFHGALEAIAPTLDALRPAIEVVAKVFGAALAPVLKGLFPIFKLTAIAATYVGQVFFKVAGFVLDAAGWIIKGWGHIMKALATAIDKLPFVSAKGAIKFAEGIIKTGGALQDAADGFREGADALGEGRKELQALEWGEATEPVEKAAKDFAAGITNQARVINLQLHRYRASTAGIPGSSGAASSAAAGGAGGGLVVHGGVHVHAAPGDDGEAMYREFMRVLREKVAAGEVTDLHLLMARAS
jgi:hypothetical protein